MWFSSRLCVPRTPLQMLHILFSRSPSRNARRHRAYYVLHEGCLVQAILLLGCGAGTTTTCSTWRCTYCICIARAQARHPVFRFLQQDRGVRRVALEPLERENGEREQGERGRGREERGLEASTETEMEARIIYVYATDGVKR